MTVKLAFFGFFRIVEIADAFYLETPFFQIGRIFIFLSTGTDVLAPLAGALQLLMTIELGRETGGLEFGTGQ